MSKWFVLPIAAGVCLAVWLTYARITKSVPVPAAKVEIGDIQEFVDERGKTRLPRVYLITMPYTGRLEEIGLQEGDPVYAGQEVARIVPSDLQLSVDAATAAVQRLEAATKENDDTSVEETGLKQAIQFVTSMDRSVEAALSRVQSGKAKKDFAESQFQRKQSLVAQNAASKEEVEQAEVNLVQSRVDLRQDELVHSAMVALQTATALMPTMVRQYIDRKFLSHDVLVKQKAEAMANLAQVEQDQRRGTMYSPIDGVVLARHITNERYISAGTTLLELGRLENLEVEADVLSQDVVNVKPGDQVRVYGPAIGASGASGKVDRIFPAGFTKVSSLGVEQQRVKVIVKIDQDDLRRLLDQGLGVDYRVRMRVVTDQMDKVPVIPRSALFRGENGRWQVFAVQNGRAQLTEIEIGLMNDDRVEVHSGLRPADVVVLAPERGLTDGQRVAIQFNKSSSSGESE